MVVEAGEEDDGEGVGHVQGPPVLQQQPHKGQELLQVHLGGREGGREGGEGK